MKIKRNIKYIQISDSLINKKELKETNENKYNNLYFNLIGIEKPIDFWEIPFWIVEMDYFCFNHYNSDLYVINDMDKKQYLKDILDNNPKYIFFSILEVNKIIIKELIKKLEKEIRIKNLDTLIICGGYIDKKYIDINTKVKWFNSPKDFAIYSNIQYEFGTNYKLFENYKCLPRLLSSSGCPFKCTFCTIDNKIIKKTKTEIFQQLYSFKTLDFKYIYIDEKTFGLSNNKEYIKEMFYFMKKQNDKFKGFIIQTTVNTINNNLIDFNEPYIKMVEFGIETFNTEILKKYNKPITEDSIKMVIKKLGNKDIILVPNIIFGFPEENKKTISKTFDFIYQNYKYFGYINIYTLSIYDNTEISNRIKNLDDNDKNENFSERSYYSENLNLFISKTKEKIYSLFI